MQSFQNSGTSLYLRNKILVIVNNIQTNTEVHYHHTHESAVWWEKMNQMTTNPWPALPLAEWKDTYSTLHMWTQIVGKIRLKLTPLLNHWWNVTLYVTPRGLITSTMSSSISTCLPVSYSFERAYEAWSLYGKSWEIVNIDGDISIVPESCHIIFQRVYFRKLNNI